MWLTSQNKNKRKKSGTMLMEVVIATALLAVTIIPVFTVLVSKKIYQHEVGFISSNNTSLENISIILNDKFSDLGKDFYKSLYSNNQGTFYLDSKTFTLSGEYYKSSNCDLSINVEDIYRDNRNLLCEIIDNDPDPDDSFIDEINKVVTIKSLVSPSLGLKRSEDEKVYSGDDINQLRISNYYTQISGSNNCYNYDGDEYVNAIDLCPNVPSNGSNYDYDSDGIGDICDNCPFAHNSFQAKEDVRDLSNITYDSQSTSFGDACDINSSLIIDSNSYSLKQGDKETFLTFEGSSLGENNNLNLNEQEHQISLWFNINSIEGATADSPSLLFGKGEYANHYGVWVVPEGDSNNFSLKHKVHIGDGDIQEDEIFLNLETGKWYFLAMEYIPGGDKTSNFWLKEGGSNNTGLTTIEGLDLKAASYGYDVSDQDGGLKTPFTIGYAYPGHPKQTSLDAKVSDLYIMFLDNGFGDESIANEDKVSGDIYTHVFNDIVRLYQDKDGVFSRDKGKFNYFPLNKVNLVGNSTTFNNYSKNILSAHSYDIAHIDEDGDGIISSNLRDHHRAWYSRFLFCNNNKNENCIDNCRHVSNNDQSVSSDKGDGLACSTLSLGDGVTVGISGNQIVINPSEVPLPSQEPQSVFVYIYTPQTFDPSDPSYPNELTAQYFSEVIINPITEDGEPGDGVIYDNMGPGQIALLCTSAGCENESPVILSYPGDQNPNPEDSLELFSVHPLDLLRVERDSVLFEFDFAELRNIESNLYNMYKDMLISSIQSAGEKPVLVSLLEYLLSSKVYTGLELLDVDPEFVNLSGPPIFPDLIIVESVHVDKIWDLLGNYKVRLGVDPSYEEVNEAEYKVMAIAPMGIDNQSFDPDQETYAPLMYIAKLHQYLIISASSSYLTGSYVVKDQYKRVRNGDYTQAPLLKEYFENKENLLSYSEHGDTDIINMIISLTSVFNKYNLCASVPIAENITFNLCEVFSNLFLDFKTVNGVGGELLINTDINNSILTSFSGTPRASLNDLLYKYLEPKPIITYFEFFINSDLFSNLMADSSDGSMSSEQYLPLNLGTVFFLPKNLFYQEEDLDRVMFAIQSQDSLIPNISFILKGNYNFLVDLFSSLMQGLTQAEEISGECEIINFDTLSDAALTDRNKCIYTDFGKYLFTITLDMSKSWEYVSSMPNNPGYFITEKLKEVKLYIYSDRDITYFTSNQNFLNDDLHPKSKLIEGQNIKMNYINIFSTFQLALKNFWRYFYDNIWAAYNYSAEIDHTMFEFCEMVKKGSYMFGNYHFEYQVQDGGDSIVNKLYLLQDGEFRDNFIGEMSCVDYFQEKFETYGGCFKDEIVNKVPENKGLLCSEKVDCEQYKYKIRMPEAIEDNLDFSFLSKDTKCPISFDPNINSLEDFWEGKINGCINANGFGATDDHKELFYFDWNNDDVILNLCTYNNGIEYLTLNKIMKDSRLNTLEIKCKDIGEAEDCEMPNNLELIIQLMFNTLEGPGGKIELIKNKKLIVE